MTGASNQHAWVKGSLVEYCIRCFILRGSETLDRWVEVKGEDKK